MKNDTLKKPVSDDLEEAADEHVNNIAYCGDDIELEKEQSKRAFIAGAEWQAEQMMKEAVEGTIDDCGTPARLRLEMPGGSFRIGDRVRIWDKVCVIVLPKEGEK